MKQNYAILKVLKGGGDGGDVLFATQNSTKLYGILKFLKCGVAGLGRKHVSFKYSCHTTLIFV